VNDSWVHVEEFETAYRDFLTIGGTRYWGMQFSGPDAIHVDGNINWASNSYYNRKGWKLCPTTAPPTPVPTPKPTIQGWTITGDCLVNDGCATSSNFPENYYRNEACTIAVNDLWVHVEEFDTETYFDFLTIGGTSYHGEQFSGPDAIHVDGNITWSSDESVVRKGWKLCPTTAPTTNSNTSSNNNNTNNNNTNTNNTNNTNTNNTA